jgi:hypothetical protein
MAFPRNLRSLAETVLPAPLYQRLSGSSIAKRLARGPLWSLLGSATSRLLVLLAMIGVFDLHLVEQPRALIAIGSAILDNQLNHHELYKL